ncbi:MAG TPA: myo-inosose-2 dehydratase [Steroidobacteraceae bacterium]|nr:myo-inosose-2 dehydratase [Steroidobacteraceae bacterium]
MSVRFGVSPIAWINDDLPELGGETPVEVVLRDAHALGFEGIELGGRFSRDAVRLGTQLSTHELALIGGWWSAALLVRSVEEEIEALQPHLQLLEALGSSVFIIAECSNSIHGNRQRPLATSPRLPDSRWHRFGERLSTLARYLEDRGLRLAYHFHLGTVVERQDDIERLIAHTDAPVGFVVDTGHAALGGIDAEQLIRNHPDRVIHVHTKDVRRRVFADTAKRNGSFLDGVLAGMFTSPGDGDLDFRGVAQALIDIGYDGWVVVEAEQDPALADPRTYSRIGLQTVQRLLGPAARVPGASR